MDLRPIGVFDSGVGGLTVAKEIIKLMPNEEICYFGDCRRAPYGNKDKETLAVYAMEIAQFLMQQNVKAMVVACNTMSATCLDILKNNFDIPIIDVLYAGVLAVYEQAHSSVCLLATKATVDSGMHKRLVLEKNENLEVKDIACPNFVSIVEAGLANSHEAYEEAKKYMVDCDFNKIDTLLLGCTHYPLMEKAIRKVTGEKVNIINPAYKCALMLKEELAEKNLLSNSPNPKHKIYASDISNFDSFLHEHIDKTIWAEQIIL